MQGHVGVQPGNTWHMCGMHSRRSSVQKARGRTEARHIQDGDCAGADTTPGWDVFRASTIGWFVVEHCAASFSSFSVNSIPRDICRARAPASICAPHRFVVCATDLAVAREAVEAHGDDIALALGAVLLYIAVQVCVVRGFGKGDVAPAPSCGSFGSFPGVLGASFSRTFAR